MPSLNPRVAATFVEPAEVLRAERPVPAVAKKLQRERFKRLAKTRVIETVSESLGGARDGPLAREQHSRHFTQQEAQRKSWNRRPARPMQYAAQSPAKFFHRDRMRRGCVHRAARVRIFHQKLNQTDLVFQVNPRHPLPSRSQWAADKKLK